MAGREGNLQTRYHQNGDSGCLCGFIESVLRETTDGGRKRSAGADALKLATLDLSMRVIG